MKLKNKLNLAVIGIILFFGLLAVIFVYKQTNENFIMQAKNNLIEVSSVQAHGIYNVFNRSEDLVKTIAQNPAVVQYLKEKSELADPVITEYLSQYNIGERYSAIYIMSSEGITLVSTNPTFVGKNYSFRDYFKKGMEGRTWADVAIGVTSKKAGYYFSHPVLSSEDEILGVVIVKKIPDIVHDVIDEKILDDKFAVTMLADSDGVIIFSNDESRIYKSLGFLEEDKLKEIEEKRRFSGIDIKSLGYDQLQKDLSYITETRIFNFFNKDTKQRRLITVTPINDLPFFIITERDPSEFIAVSGKISLFIALLVFVAAVTAILCIVYFLNKFLRPLDILKEGAYQLSQENFDYSLNIKTGDELEDLGSMFNQMSKKLNKTYKDLENKVKKLKHFNKLMVGRELKMNELKEEVKKLKDNN